MWDAAKKLSQHDKAKSEVFSLGLVLLEAGNLLEDVDGLNYSQKRIEQEFNDLTLE